MHRHVKGICDRCGSLRLLSELRPEPKTTLRVCRPCWDRRHPQEYLRGVPEPAFVNPAPRTASVYEPAPIYDEDGQMILDEDGRPILDEGTA